MVQRAQFRHGMFSFSPDQIHNPARAVDLTPSLTGAQYLTRPEEAEDSVNKWQARMGQPYEAWEANGWIRGKATSSRNAEQQ